ncbi:hypothetical protein KIL84_019273 [Mauremys mutica]|uniref:Lysozyme g n=1 Tax=Mauremys mutica TaxID=74926 RepID=A0A9D4BB33_9SAUR|nr:hypothetical protein KIL84_019273 [Mauremys mutica]
MLLTLMIMGLATLIGTSESQTGCYGDINKVDTTGASCRTARAERLSYCGVRASTTIAERDLGTMNNYKTIIKNAGRKKCVDPAVIAGIISRESHAGKALKDGWGDRGNGFGLMQVDKRYHKLVGKWNSEAHVLQGTGILVNMIKGIQKKFPRWTKEQQLKGTSESQTGCYGDINKVDTTGASCTTAKAERLPYCGVRASTTIAEKDLHTMNNYKTIIKNAGRKKCVDPAVIAGIISRESHAGTALRGGWGDRGNGFGLMQVDKRYHKLFGQWNSEAHVLQGTGILVDMIKGIQKKFPRWTKEQQLKGGISAYNAGLQNVQTYDKMDIGTTGNDYANDVVARAKFYKRNGYNN